MGKRKEGSKAQIRLALGTVLSGEASAFSSRIGEAPWVELRVYAQVVVFDAAGKLEHLFTAEQPIEPNHVEQLYRDLASRLGVAPVYTRS